MPANNLHREKKLCGCFQLGLFGSLESHECMLLLGFALRLGFVLTGPKDVLLSLGLV